MADECTGNFASISLCYVEKGMDKVGGCCLQRMGQGG